MSGLEVSENKIPLGRDKASAPYAVFQTWMGGADTGKCFDASDNTLKANATYANCAIRFAQDAVTKLWLCTIPSLLPSGRYLAIIRDGADGAEANTDTEVATVTMTWSQRDQTLFTTHTDVLASY